MTWINSLSNLTANVRFGARLGIARKLVVYMKHADSLRSRLSVVQEFSQELFVFTPKIKSTDPLELLDGVEPLPCKLHSSLLPPLVTIFFNEFRSSIVVSLNFWNLCEKCPHFSRSGAAPKWSLLKLLVHMRFMSVGVFVRSQLLHTKKIFKASLNHFELPKH